MIDIKNVIEEVKQTIEILEELKEREDCGCDLEMQVESEKIKLEALEKQIPKKVIKTEYRNIKGNYLTSCPNCRSQLFDFEKTKYCGECGQKLDWSVENEY